MKLFTLTTTLLLLLSPAIALPTSVSSLSQANTDAASTQPACKPSCQAYTDERKYWWHQRNLAYVRFPVSLSLLTHDFLHWD